VRSYKGDWGFATSPQFAGDIFIGTRNNPHLHRPLQEGDSISFTVERNGAKFEAVNVSLGGYGARDRSRSPYSSYLAPPPPLPPGKGSRQSSSIAGRTLTGWVRSFKGSWGFAVSNDFDGDIFVGKSTNSHLQEDLRSGDMIRFVAQYNGNKIEAAQVEVIGHGSVPAGSGRTASGKSTDVISTIVHAAAALERGKPGKPVARPAQSTSPRASSRPRDPLHFVGKEAVVGTIRSYRGTWGFATSNAFDGDVFVGKNSNPQLSRDLQQGDRIAFKIGMDASGKPFAQDVMLLEG